MAEIFNTNNLSRHFDPKKKSEIFENIQNFFEYASQRNIRLGYLRGSGFSDPFLRKLIKADQIFFNLKLFPDIWINGGLNFSLDVEYERGSELIEKFKEYKIFRLPMIDIINKTEGLVEKKIPFEKYLDNSPEILNLFMKGKLDQVWAFDQVPSVMPYEELFRNENLSSLEDALNLYILNTIGNIDVLKEYWERKNSYQRANKDILSTLLKQSFGSIIYHEDIIEIFHHFTGWDYSKCDLLRRNLRNNRDGGEDWELCREIMGLELSTRILKSGKITFSKAHLFSTYTIIRKSLILRNFFEGPYFKSLAFLEQKFSVPWNYFET